MRSVNMMVGVVATLLAQTSAALAGAAAEVIPIPNGDFSAGEAHWFFSRERGVQTRATAEFCASRPGALRIYADADKGIGARVDGTLVPVRGPGIVELHGKVCAFSGRHLGLWIRQYDAERELLPVENWGEVGGGSGKWRSLLREVVLDEKTAFLQLWFRAYPSEGEVIDVFLDDLSFVRPAMPIPPWPSQYKLTPADTDRLTAADVVGPDGIVYPNWTQVGVQGGIPDVAVAVKLADRGAKPATDIADLLDQACRDAGAGGGGAVLLGEGTFHLGRPITIKGRGVVIRGAGRDKTRLIFNAAVGRPGTDVGLYWPGEGEAAGPDTVVEAHAWHTGLKGFKMFLNDKEVAGVEAHGYGEAQRVPGSTLLEMAGVGEAALRVEALYQDGRSSTAKQKIILSDTPQVVKAGPSIRSLLFFVGAGLG